MLIEKLARHVVRVQTPIGPRYVMPSFLERIYLLWMFRNFAILPYAVLSVRQQRMIDRMCSEQPFESIAYVNGMGKVAVIGTIERRPMNQSLPTRHAVARETGTLAAQARQRSIVVQGLRWMRLLIHEEKDKQTFEHLIEALENCWQSEDRDSAWPLQTAARTKTAHILAWSSPVVAPTVDTESWLDVYPEGPSTRERLAS